MSTGLLEQRANYPRSQYEYGLGGHGTADADNNGRKEIDCSNLLNRMLRDAGYDIPYKTTAQLANDTTYFDVIPLADVDVNGGDIALWVTRGHTGVVEDLDANRVKGNFFGSQTSTGPKSAKFGLNSNYWPMPDKFLRPKAQYKTGGQPTPAPAAPAPAPAPAGPAPLMTFQYPIRKADGKQFTDAEEIYQALGAETSGHYLLGCNKFWHGGIHITDTSAPQCVLNEPVRCMADGEVVAYRLNDDYLESTFGDNEKKLKYSNSFCLVRHEYKSVPNPDEGPNKGKQNTLNFYSLYMHLLPYQRYPLAETERPTPKVTMTVNDFKAYDVFPEANGTPSPGKLSTGTKLEILEQKDVGNVTYARGKILSGSVKNVNRKVREAGAEVWFAYLKNGAPYQNSEPKNIWTADKIVERLRPNYWQGKVKATVVNKLDLYADPASPQNGQPAGAKLGNLQLITGSVVEFDSKDVLNLTVNGVTRRMAKCTKISGDLAGAGTAPSSFWACVENQRDYRILDWTSLTPTSFNTVETASTGIKAGDPIGYLGLTENITSEEGGVNSKHQVHVEIFTAEAGVKDFLKNVAGLKSGKQYLHLAVGVGLKKKAPATDVTPLKNQHAVDLSKAPVIKEGTEDWYEVSVIENGQPVSGLIKKTEAEIVTQHDWEKLGFQIVEECNTAADGFLDPEDTPQFFKDLFAKIDTNHNGEVDAGELAEALKNAETRDQWSKLIAHHPTEWKDKADAPKWSKLDQLLEGSPKTLKHEKERIDEMVFWDDLTGGAAIGNGIGVITHFHPVAIISNLLPSNRCFCFEQGIVNSPCQVGFRDVTKEHFELLAMQLGVEREVLRAIAVAETGDKVPFKEFVAGKQHAAILYERHYMYRFLKVKGYTSQQLDDLSTTEPKIVHVYQSGYSYGTEQAQYERLLRARELDKDSASKACSWGKFQVMGEYYSQLYESVDELVEAQNYCALQHLQYFKVFLTKEKNMLEPMKNKNWLTIAKKYNGANQVGYDTRISNAYTKLKAEW
ncbi:DUF3380 domain-containing protein [Pseudomonas sp. MAFF 730085]|uniref:DUF3380 domain-containing protein n=1 Tax=Pseudomonas kitaguniensis TaxID=2607908 RepID=A0A5N7JSJ8_9PSED|nr:N-acetylmuramidase domain-containing protein [Pseudomonas kitaguniensis]MPQ84276.1 DUF3380 domain-containing protein [Pseudomonas kitaguniensis]